MESKYVGSKWAIPQYHRPRIRIKNGRAMGFSIGMRTHQVTVDMIGLNLTVVIYQQRMKYFTDFTLVTSYQNGINYG